MKAILFTWRDITHKEYQEFVHMIPDPEEAMSMQKLKGGLVMTDTCKSSHKTNYLLAQIVDGHSLFYHNHQRNVWVKNMLDVISNYVSTLIKDNLEEIVLNQCTHIIADHVQHIFHPDVALMMMTEQGVSVNYLGKQAVSFMGDFTSVGHHRTAF